VIGLTNHYLHVEQLKSSALNHNQKLIFISHINILTFSLTVLQTHIRWLKIQQT